MHKWWGWGVALSVVGVLGLGCGGGDTTHVGGEAVEQRPLDLPPAGSNEVDAGTSAGAGVMAGAAGGDGGRSAVDGNGDTPAAPESDVAPPVGPEDAGVADSDAGDSDLFGSEPPVVVPGASDAGASAPSDTEPDAALPVPPDPDPPVGPEPPEADAGAEFPRGRLCTPNEFLCIGSQLLRCRESGLAYDIVRSCELLERCDASNGTCVGQER